MTMLRALVEHFVAPAQDAVRPAPVPTELAVTAVTAVPPGVGVLCGPRHAVAAGSAVALRLAQRHRARAAVVAVWPAERPGVPGAPPAREARRVATALGSRDLATHVAGRVVLTALPGDQHDAAAAAERAFAVAAHLPTVLVLAGPREEPLDALLRARDLVLVADDLGDAVAALALDVLRRQGVPAQPCTVPTALVAAAAARGAVVLPAARRGLDVALEGLA
jgi:hypothetical protein